MLALRVLHSAHADVAQWQSSCFVNSRSSVQIRPSAPLEHENSSGFSLDGPKPLLFWRGAGLPYRPEAALADRPNVPRWQAVLIISKAQALCDTWRTGRSCTIGHLWAGAGAQLPVTMPNEPRAKADAQARQRRARPIPKVAALARSGLRHLRQWPQPAGVVAHTCHHPAHSRQCDVVEPGSMVSLSGKPPSRRERTGTHQALSGKG